MLQINELSGRHDRASFDCGKPELNNYLRQIPENCEPLIGVVALESMGIGIDPMSRSLKRMAAKPLK